MKLTTQHWLLGGLGLLILLLPKKAKGNTSNSLPGARDCSVPRGIRNNNPGNIVVSSSAWKGKISYDQNTDYNCNTGKIERRFEQFVSYEYGIRAMILLLKNYITRDGLNTVRRIIEKWAPASDGNNVNNYASLVATYSGLHIDAPFTATPVTLKLLTKAMAKVENGRDCISDRQFDDAWLLSIA